MRIAGHLPPWVLGAGQVPVGPWPTKYRGSTANLRAAVEHPGVTQEFLYFNDDFFVMPPLAAMLVLHRGPAARVEQHYVRRSKGVYLRGLRETRGLLPGWGTATRSTTSHTSRCP